MRTTRTMNRRPYLIIGNSVAAMGAVAGIREVDPDRPITIVAREPHHTYSRPLISYLLGGKVEESQMPYRPADFYEKNNVRAILGVEATGVDTEAQTVQTAAGKSLVFEKLLIATGGRPIVPRDLASTNAEGVFTFTTWDDARNIKAFIEGNAVQDAVVVGAGLIGLKSVEALVALGIKTTVVELADRILSATFDQTASDLARKTLEHSGVTVHYGNTVGQIEQREGKVTGVILRDRTRVACGLVIFAIGVIPDTRILADTPIEVDQGILVDSSMRTSVPGIYAAGDVAQAVDLLSGQRRCIAIFPNAYRQGWVAGIKMAGGEGTYAGGITMNSVDVCGLPTISVGIVTPEGEGYEVLSELDEQTPNYKKFILRDDRIVGAIFVGQIDRAGIITGLIREKINVDSFKDMLLTEAFGVVSLPTEYRKHLVSGMGIEV